MYKFIFLISRMTLKLSGTVYFHIYVYLRRGRNFFWGFFSCKESLIKRACVTYSPALPTPLFTIALLLEPPLICRFNSIGFGKETKQTNYVTPGDW